ncbi:MAG: phenylacetate--CoA ligase [Bacteroidetes bacterium]|nr:phenylacetate--CoA ligase [Bacteroidota bacterium]
MFQPDIETMPLPQLRKLQSERLKNQLGLLYDKVPFYRRKMDEAGIRPQDFRGIEDIHKLPFTKKSDLRDHYPYGLMTMPLEDISRIHASSGTTGKPTVVGYSRKDISIFSEVVARSLVAAGGRPGMMLQNAYGYGLFTGGLGLHYGAELLGMTVVPVSGGMTDRQLLLLQDFKPHMIACTPSYAQTLGEEVVRRGIDVSKLNLRYAILGAEPWTEAVRSDVEKNLHVTATNIYGLSEIIGPGVSQEDYEERGSGSYVWEDHFFPEIVDKDSGEPLEEGKHGVLVFTTLTKEAMPLLRYWTNDITWLNYDKSGKRTHIKMGPIIGRSDDMLIIRGVNLFHTQIEDLLQNMEGLAASYQLVVTRDKAMDEVEVLVEVDKEHYRALGEPSLSDPESTPERFLEIRNRFISRIKGEIGLTMQVTLQAPGKIPRSEGGKLSRIKDLRVKK